MEASFPLLLHGKLHNLLVPRLPLLLLPLLPHHGEEVHGVRHGVHRAGRLHSLWTVLHLYKDLRCMLASVSDSQQTEISHLNRSHLKSSG